MSALLAFSWTYYADPVPAWVTTRAVYWLDKGNATKDPHALVGFIASMESGEDGNMVQFSYAWHPPDGQNPTYHLGVEAKYLTHTVFP